MVREELAEGVVGPGRGDAVATLVAADILPAAVALDVVGEVGDLGAGDVDVVVVVVAHADGRAVDALVADAVAGPGLAAVAIDAPQVVDSLLDVVNNIIAKAVSVAVEVTLGKGWESAYT